MNRSTWHARTSAVVLTWLAAAAVVALAHRQVPASTWLMVHLMMLGAVTNALVIWSWHFTVAVLRAPPARSRRGEVLRLVAINVGVLAVVAGVLLDAAPAVAVGAVVLAGAVLSHVVSLLTMMRRALPSRFAITVRAYVAAGLLLIPGIALGVALADGSQAPAVHSQLLLAHVSVNLMGWVGLPIMGTLVTLWPTMLRTRLAPEAERNARRALPAFILGTLITAAGVLASAHLVAVAGIAAYLVGIGWTIGPMAVAMRQRPPASFPAWSTLAGVAWIVLSLASFALVLALNPDAETATQSMGTLTAAVAVGGVLQVLLGALSYLLPVMAGGGPAAMRQRIAHLDRGLGLRVVTVNLGLAVCVLPSPSAVRVLASVAVLAALVSTGALLVTGTRAAPPGVDPATLEDAVAAAPGLGQHSHGIALGLAVILLAVAGGVALDPAALGGAAARAEPASAGVAATGEVTRVTVTIQGMRFTPDTLRVPAGNSLQITVVNSGDDVHDLVLETGERTPRLSPGQSATLGIPVAGRDLAGWCSIAGHRQMGMVLAIEVDGVSDTTAGLGTSGEHTDHTEPTGTGADPESAESPRPDLMAEPGPGFSAYDPRLAPAAPSATHRVRLVVTETVAEVAPGVRQTRWTFGGTAPGPVLRGRVGDTFLVTLVNDGSIGHSIDFHAGALAPDRPMRTIAPGEELLYRFTATRAGIWMYHCSTMPMSMHIANGMFGAVIIDPPDLAPVDEEFVLVQSESYLGPHSGTADADAIAAGEHDLVSFNGYPMQYRHQPLTVRVGDRVRIWVLTAGPNVASAFHVVGGQFDTVYREGTYDLTPGTGGSQVLGLFPAQGGFVELTLPEAGNYPFVSHIMSDAERGATGILQAIVAP